MTEQTKKHAEAFCLMEYKCQGCARRELIWNSRDGVSSFGTGCPDPQCTGNMNHINWSLDRPFDSLPADADRVIVDMTREDARKIADKRIHLFYEEPNRPPQISFEDLVANIYRDGHQPLTVSVEEYKRRAGIEEPEPVELAFIAAVLEDYAHLQESGEIEPADRYSASEVRMQLGALEEAYPEILEALAGQSGPAPGDFAKVYRLDDFGQVLVTIVGPHLRVIYQPRIPKILPVELTVDALKVEEGGVSIETARSVLDQMTPDRVRDLVECAEGCILQAETQGKTQH